MFANQFRKITPFSLLLGGFLNAIVLFSIFSMENREIPFSSVFLTPLLLWVVCMLFCYELIWLESKRIVFYFKGFHFVTLSTALLVYPFETIAIDLVIQVGVFFLIFDGLVQTPKRDEEDLKRMFNISVLVTLLSIYNTAQIIFFLPLLFFFSANRLTKFKMILALLLPIVSIPLFFYSILIYWNLETMIPFLNWQYDPWDFKNSSIKDYGWLLLILVGLFIHSKVSFSKKQKAIVRINFGLAIWLVSSLIFSFIYTNASYGRWEWTIFPIVLMMSNIFKNIDSNRTVNLLLGSIFTGGVLIRIFVL